MPGFGKDCVAYLASADLSESNEAGDASWTEVDNLQDETDNFTSEEVDITTRATAKLGWNATAFTTKNAEVQFTFLNEPNDVLATALIAAWLASDTVPMMFLSDDIATDGAIGLAANWSVSLVFNRPVKGVQSMAATLKARSFQEWVEIEAS